MIRPKQWQRGTVGPSSVLCRHMQCTGHIVYEWEAVVEAIECKLTDTPTYVHVHV